MLCSPSLISKNRKTFTKHKCRLVKKATTIITSVNKGPEKETRNLEREKTPNNKSGIDSKKLCQSVFHPFSTEEKNRIQLPALRATLVTGRAAAIETECRITESFARHFFAKTAAHSVSK